MSEQKLEFREGEGVEQTIAPPVPVPVPPKSPNESVTIITDNFYKVQEKVITNNRMVLIDWLVEVHMKWKLHPNTLWLAFIILDLYLAKVSVYLKDLQLVGISSLAIACRYEEVETIPLSRYQSICADTYPESRISDMELTILQQLEWNVADISTCYQWIVYFVDCIYYHSPSAATVSPVRFLQKKRKHIFLHVALYIAERNTMNHFFMRHDQKTLAAAAVYSAFLLLHVNKEFRTRVIVAMTPIYEEDEDFPAIDPKELVLDFNKDSFWQEYMLEKIGLGCQDNEEVRSLAFSLSKSCGYDDDDINHADGVPLLSVRRKYELAEYSYASLLTQTQYNVRYGDI